MFRDLKALRKAHKISWKRYQIRMSTNLKVCCTRLGMFGVRQHYPRRRQSTRLYSQPSDYEEEPSMFPATSALVEILRRKKMEKDRLDAEIKAQQHQAEQETIEAAVLKARQEEEERFLAEQRTSFLL